MELSAIITDWYTHNKRDLPWRNTHDAYRIWVSEIILQQTRVAQGVSYYKRFIERFPTIQDLANASLTEVLRLWQGLGYYSRARNMHKAAQQCQGPFPTRYHDLLQLPGIGDYTAAAISSFATDECHATVDGNVYRVLARWFDIDTAIDTTAGTRLFKQLANEIIDPAHPGLHNQAMMEFGARQCTPTQPDCANCPARDGCLALANDTVNERPVKQGKTRQRTRHLYYLDIHCGDHLFLHQRNESDIWQGLYEMPLIEQEAEPDSTQLDNLLRGTGYALGCWSGEIKHILSHQVLRVKFLPIEVERANAYLEEFDCIASSRLDDYPLSRLTLKYLENKKG